MNQRLKSALLAIGVIGALAIAPSTTAAAVRQTCSIGPLTYTVVSNHLSPSTNSARRHLDYHATAMGTLGGNTCAQSGHQVSIDETAHWDWNPSNPGALTGSYSAVREIDNNRVVDNTWAGMVHGLPGPTAAASGLRVQVSARSSGWTLTVMQNAMVNANNAGAPLRSLNASSTTATTGPCSTVTCATP